METLRWGVSSGETIVNGDVSVTPQCRAMILRTPWGGLVWNAPWSLRIERDGQSEEIPIVDVTRQAQIAAAAAGILVGLLLVFLTGTRKRAKDE